MTTTSQRPELNLRPITINLSQLEASGYFGDAEAEIAREAKRWVDRMGRLADYAGITISMKWTGMIGAVDTISVDGASGDEEPVEYTPEYDWFQAAADAAIARGRLRYQ